MTTFEKPSEGLGTTTDWSPDGAQIAFTSFLERSPAGLRDCHVQNGVDRAWVVHLDAHAGFAWRLTLLLVLPYDRDPMWVHHVSGPGVVAGASVARTASGSC